MPTKKTPTQEEPTKREMNEIELRQLLPVLKWESEGFTDKRLAEIFLDELDSGAFYLAEEIIRQSKTHPKSSFLFNKNVQ